MAIVEIPTRNDLPSFQQLVSLDGVNYTIGFYFNARMNDGSGVWQCWLADQNQNLICASVSMPVSWPLFDKYVDEPIPPGTIFAFDTSGQNLDAGQFDLGSRVRVFYIEEGT